MTISVLICDDETPARDRLIACALSQRDCKIAGTATTGREAVNAIATLQPTAVFLDVQMPMMDGFDVIEAVGMTNMPPTVLVTAYEHYALRAFDSAVLDYLLKPFADMRFNLAFERIRSRLVQPQPSQTCHPLATPSSDNITQLEAQADRAGYLQRVAIESRRRTYTISIQEVDYISGSGVYVELHVGERSFLVRQRMSDLENQLDPHCFLRVHRSTIVQLDRICYLNRLPGNEYSLKLRTGAEVAVSRSRFNELSQWMGRRRDNHA